MSGTGEAGMIGSAPVVTITPTKPKPLAVVEGASDEALKYRKMWAHSEYRGYAPGETVAQVFLAQAKPRKGATVIDFGAGTGRGALALALLGGVRVHMLDFADNCLDPEIREALTTQADYLQFTVADLNKRPPVTAPYGFCTDVMEHIPPAEVDLVLQNILISAQHVFFQISCVDDDWGKLIGQPLHLSVHPHAWWLKKFTDLDCIIHWSKDYGGSCFFYVTAWQGAKAIADAGLLNEQEQKVKANVRANIAAGWQQVEPHETNDFELMILGGGPSLPGQLDKIRQLRAEGVKLITLNGTYNWAIEQGLVPSAQVMVDARPFNARFTKPIVDTCKYLIASQCDPSVLEGLPKERTYLWHSDGELIRDELLAAYGADGVAYPVPGGQTVLLRAIPLLRMLGFKRFHLFGCDSCISQGAHHAYAQPENDSPHVIPVTVGKEVFQCQPWMVAQAQGFMDIVRFLADEIEIEVYGGGLLAYILEYGGELHAEDSFLV